MSIEVQERPGWQRWLNRLLPQDCLLCGTPAAGDLLCAPCLADLPRLPEEHCPVCALPTPGAAVCGECLRHPPHFDATLAAFAVCIDIANSCQMNPEG